MLIIFLYTDIISEKNYLHENHEALVSNRKEMINLNRHVVLLSHGN